MTSSRSGESGGRVDSGGRRSSGSLPARIVAVGGGTGLPAVLRGLRQVVALSDDRAITAVVAVTDDGGSSGRLRRDLGVPPPGDIRNCLVALASEEDLLSALFQYRYRGKSELGGHSVGNLILAALAERSGCMVKAIEQSSRVLRTVGRILPATAADVRLEARLEDGTTVTGETRIASLAQPIRRIVLSPQNVSAAPGVVEAILGADLIVLGPGSLYTSLLPNIAVTQIAEALRATTAAIVLVANLVSERGESAGLSLADHVRIIEEHAGGEILSGVLVHEGSIDASTRERYRQEGAVPMRWIERCSRPGLRVVRKALLAEDRKLRHDPARTAVGLLELWAKLAARRMANERI